MTDQEREEKIAEARANGYTEEQIKEFVNQHAPAPAGKEPFVNRNEEKWGTGEIAGAGLAGLAAKYGIEYLAGKKLLSAAGNAFRGNPSAGAGGASGGAGAGGASGIKPGGVPYNAGMMPEGGPIAPEVAPTTLSGGANPAFDAALAKPYGAGPVLSSVAPAAAFSAPYAMAAYEQSKIRQNPNAPEYATNPYAQQVRGEAPTQGAAGAMNTRNAIAGQQYGGLSKAEQDMLQQDAIDRQIRLKAAQKALQPVVPGQ